MSVTNVQLRNPDGGWHREINGVDPAVAETMVNEGTARIVEGDVSPDEPIKDNRGKGVSMAVVESRIDAKLRLMKAELLDRMKADMQQLEKALRKGGREAAKESEEKPAEIVEKQDEPAEESAKDDEEPAPTVDLSGLPEDLKELKVGELRRVAKSLDINGRSKMNEAELVDAIEEIRTKPE